MAYAITARSARKKSRLLLIALGKKHLPRCSAADDDEIEQLTLEIANPQDRQPKQGEVVKEFMKRIRPRTTSWMEGLTTL
jgi:hypothetical protein